MRRILVTGAVAMLAAAGTAVATPAAEAATVQPNVSYVLVNRNSGKALDVYNLATTDGAPINQYTRNDGAWQQWRFLDSGSGWYRLQSVHSGKVLDLPTTADGVQLVQNTDRNDARQQFRLADSAGGQVRLINRNSGKALEVLGVVHRRRRQGLAVPGPRRREPAVAARRPRRPRHPNLHQPDQAQRPGPVAAVPQRLLLPGHHDLELHHHHAQVDAPWPAWPPHPTRSSSTCSRANGCCNMWAPEFHLINGPNGNRWYFYYTAGRNVPDYNPHPTAARPRMRRHRPDGPVHLQSRPRQRLVLDAEHPAGRQQPLPDGNLRRRRRRQSHSIQPLSNPWTAAGHPSRLSSPTLSWERQSGAVNEGPEPLHHNGKMLIVYSATALLGSRLQARAAHPAPAPTRCNPASLDEEVHPGLPAQRRQRCVRARPQRVLQVTGRHRGLDRLPRQRLRLRRLRHEPLHPRPEVHLERRRHTQLRHPGTVGHDVDRPIRRIAPRKDQSRFAPGISLGAGSGHPAQMLRHLRRRGARRRRRRAPNHRHLRPERDSHPSYPRRRTTCANRSASRSPRHWSPLPCPWSSRSPRRPRRWTTASPGPRRWAGTTGTRFGCNVSDSLIRQTADAMVSSGMAAAGYQYVNIDDCWSTPAATPAATWCPTRRSSPTASRRSPTTSTARA